jgi:RND family efflux transporter MFP subunit
MTVAHSSAEGGQIKLIISCALFVVALITLLVMAGLGNATQVPEARVPMAVSTGTVKIQEGFEAPISVFGLVESPKTTSLSFDIAGQVTDINVEEGDNVQEGDVLAHQDLMRLNARKKELSATLARAIADFELASVNKKRTVALVEKQLESSQRLDEVTAVLNVAKAQVNEIEASINSLDVEIAKATLVSPFSGIVNRRFVDEGAVVGVGTPVIGITSVEALQARFAVPADVIEQFGINNSVTVRISEQEVRGIVSQQLPVRNLQTRTIDILVTLDSSVNVRAGDMAVLVGSRFHKEVGSWLPVNALSNGLRGLWRVFVLSDGQTPKLEARVVEVVYTDGNNAFVRGALKEGDIFVNEGTHKLAPGQMVSVSHQLPAGAR